MGIRWSSTGSRIDSRRLVWGMALVPLLLGGCGDSGDASDGASSAGANTTAGESQSETTAAVPPTTTEEDAASSTGTVDVCSLVPAGVVAALTGRSLDEADDRTIGFRGECAYKSGGAIEVTIGVQFYGEDNIDFGFDDNVDGAPMSLDGLGDRAVVVGPDADFELVVQHGGYIVLVGLRGEQPVPDQFRAIGLGLLEQLAPAIG